MQIHPTTSTKKIETFIFDSELFVVKVPFLNKTYVRFVDELQPRDVVAQAILNKWKDGTDHVWEDLRTILKELEEHFPNIGTPSKLVMTHHRMHSCCASTALFRGIKVNHRGKTTMDALYAVGETALMVFTVKPFSK